MFGKSDKRPTVQSLGEESVGILSIFRNALDSLSNVNEKVKQERELKLAEAKQAQEDAASLKTLCDDNDSVMNNISKLLNKQKNVEKN